MTVTNGIGAAGWRLFECESAVSTNDLAREFAAWSAVRAETQSGGRGRFGRAFISDPGGLWISAVLPTEGGPAKWAGFSLRVGVALVQMLEALDAPFVRLRWPNDLMCGQKKLGGLLIEQFSPDRLIVGFGLNVSNAPWEADAALEPVATSLTRVLTTAPSVAQMAVFTLNALAEAHAEMVTGGMTSAINDLNERWREPIPVRVALSDGTSLTGQFVGLDPLGNLRLRDALDYEFLVPHQRVERLTEIP